ncbi:hypothetical protein WR25_07418 [Diploscapter pachys]|uniref:Uncharacterized protein n=1 Tax=Diploscapter pachys TaxID=2018661 RepID=A0A2A2K6T4_9BILA|nr:hypothetical protein WR25_07418 [Diploscapter pachys]
MCEARTRSLRGLATGFAKREKAATRGRRGQAVLRATSSRDCGTWLCGCCGSCSSTRLKPASSSAFSQLPRVRKYHGIGRQSPANPTNDSSRQPSWWTCAEPASRAAATRVASPSTPTASMPLAANARSSQPSPQPISSTRQGWRPSTARSIA